MLALYRSGRQSEALECYRQGRRVLVDELGIEPGRPLQDLHQAILRQDVPSVAPPPVAPRRRRVALAAVLLAAAAAGVAALVVRYDGNGGGRAAPSVSSWSLVGVDPVRGAVVADVPLGALPGPAAAGVSRVWVATGSRILLSIDPHSRRVVNRVGLPASPHDLAAGEGIVWIANGYDGTISRLDERVGFVSPPFRPEPGSTGRLAIAVGFGSLWVGSQDGVLARIDPTRDRLIALIRGIRTPHALAIGEGAVWLIEATRAAVLRIDPGTNRIETVIEIGSLPTAIAVGAGAVWAATSDGRVWRIDPRTNRVRATITTGGSPSAVVVSGSAVWVVEGREQTLRRIDPSSNEVTATLEIRRPIADVVQADGLLWATVQ